MKRKRIPVKPYLDAPICVCGGVFKERSGSVVYMSNPQKAEFKCKNCGNTQYLAEPDWPGIKYEIEGGE